jgi:hypothetical protein
VAFHVEHEPEWDDDQAALLIAARAQLEDVGPHGIPMSEATDPLADPNDRLHGWHYEARFRVDHAQRALSQALAERAKTYPDEDQSALLVTLERVEDPPRRS